MRQNGVVRHVGAVGLFAIAISTAVACTPMYRREHGTPAVRSDGSIGPESRATGKARRFAVEHFKCPSSEIAVQQVSDEVFAANGCGRTATIICAKGVRGKCVARDDEPVAQPAPAKVEAKEFDAKIARSSLLSVSYADCGVGGRGRVRLTIEPTGRTSSVEVIEGTYDEATTKCLVQRFAKVSVPPFDGLAHVVLWTVTLADE